MKPSLMEILACPVCKGPLELKVETEETLRQASFDKLRMNEGEREKEIITGSLRCAKCNATYPITDSIPNLLPPETTST